MKAKKAEMLIDRIIDQAKKVAILQRSGDRDAWLEERQVLENLREELLNKMSAQPGPATR